jgi:arsenate reductase (thioredoxin)
LDNDIRGNLVKKLLFVCIENSCRSQMAEAFAKIHGNKKLFAYSAGSKASGIVNEKAIKSMSEIGYDLCTHRSVGLTEIPDVVYDVVVTMGCGDKCPNIMAKSRQDWDMSDPKNMNEKDFNKVRDRIEDRVKILLAEIS